MEIRNVSSEDLSSYSILCESSQRGGRNQYLNGNSRARKNRLSITNVKQPVRLKSLKISKTEPQASSKNNIKSHYPHGSKKKPTKLDNKDVTKDNLRVSARKVKPINREHKAGIGSLTTNSAAFRNPCSSKGEEPRQLSSKNKGPRINNLGNVPLSARTETNRSGVKRKTHKVIEIEVFMPVIDSERNSITYPKSRKPVMNVYSPKAITAKSKNQTEKQKENKESGKRSYLHPKKDAMENLNEKLTSSKRKGNGTSNAKTSSAEKGIKGKDVKCTNAMNLRRKKTASTQTPAGIDANRTDLGKQRRVRTGGTARRDRSEKDLEKQKMVAEFHDLLRDITIDVENVPKPNARMSSELAGISQRTKAGNCQKETFLKLAGNLSEGVKKPCALGHRRIHQVSKSSSVAGRHNDEDDDIAFCQLPDSRNVTGSLMAPCDDEHDGKGRNQQEKKSKGILMDPKRRNGRRCKQLYSPKIALERKETNFSSPACLTKTSSRENSWRRPATKTSFSTECFPYKNKWRRNIMDDSLSIDCWIERCQYLQCKHQRFQMNAQPNSWRRTGEGD